MNLEMAIRSALVLISQLHVLASEAPQMAKAMELLMKCVKAIEQAREAQENDHHNEQGKNV